MPVNWNDLEVFCVVASLGNFTRAAERLGLPKSSTSRAVSGVESRLGVRLLERNTRRLRLTETGRELHSQLLPLFERLHDIVEESQTQRDQLRGTLRISAPFEFGILQLNEVICDLLARHEALEAEIEMSTQRQNPLDGNFDLVFSLHDSDPVDSSLVARRVLVLDTLLCAAPSLVARMAPPQHPLDLATWPCLCGTDDGPWRFTNLAGESLDVPVQGRLRTNNASLRLGATEAGLGVSVIAATLCRDAIEQGRLVALLPDWQPMPRRIYAFMPARRFMPARVRAILDALDKLGSSHGLQPALVSPLRNK